MRIEDVNRLIDILLESEHHNSVAHKAANAANVIVRELIRTTTENIIKNREMIANWQNEHNLSDADVVKHFPYWGIMKNTRTAYDLFALEWYFATQQMMKSNKNGIVLFSSKNKQIGKQHIKNLYICMKPEGDFVSGGATKQGAIYIYLPPCLQYKQTKRVSWSKLITDARRMIEEMRSILTHEITHLHQSSFENYINANDSFRSAFFGGNTASWMAYFIQNEEIEANAAAAYKQWKSSKKRTSLPQAFFNTYFADAVVKPEFGRGGNGSYDATEDYMNFVTDAHFGWKNVVKFGMMCAMLLWVHEHPKFHKRMMEDTLYAAWYEKHKGEIHEVRKMRENIFALARLAKETEKAWKTPETKSKAEEFFATMQRLNEGGISVRDIWNDAKSSGAYLKKLQGIWKKIVNS